MSTMPDSLRRILAKQQPAPKPFRVPERSGDCTTIWSDGEVYREFRGKVRQLQSIAAAKSQ